MPQWDSVILSAIPTVMTFRLSTKNLYLTYSQCPTTIKDALTWFTAFFKRNTFTYSICQELHQDGGEHLHVLLCFMSKINIVNERALDFAGPEGEVYHPNMQSAFNIRAVHAYIHKGDKERAIGHTGDDYSITYTGCGLGNHESIMCCNNHIVSGRQSWADILGNSNTKEEFMANVKSNYPRDYILSWERINVFANASYAEEVPDYESEFSVFDNVPPEVEKWKEENLVSCKHHYGCRCYDWEDFFSQ